MRADPRRFQSALIARLQRGEHIVLYGPRGGGKTMLVRELHERLTRGGVPCGFSPDTSHLDDITRALARAYPDVNTSTTTRRKARARLVSAADCHEGVLLLDHVTAFSTAMVGFLRRLRGGIAGVLFVVDVDTERERQRLRARHLGTSSLPAPPVSTPRLQRLLRACCADRGLPSVVAHQERRLVRAARGRPGWIVQCVRLMMQERYWHDGILYVSVLCGDMEIAQRQGSLQLLPHDTEDSGDVDRFI